MRVLHISQQFPCEAYPALGVMVQNAVRALQPLAEQSVLAPRPYTLPIPGFPYGRLARLPTRRIESGYWVHRPHYLYLVPKRWLYPSAGPAMAHALVRYADELGPPDVIHAHWSYPDGWAALALRELFGCKLVVHARGTLERVIAQQSPRFRELVTRPLQGADAVIANSDALHADCLGLGVSPERLCVIPNGVDLSLFVPADKAESKRALRRDPARPVLLYCGNLREVKGVDLLARALPALCEQRPALDVILVGSGELRPQLERELAELIGRGRVTLTGALPQPEVARYMQAADLLVVPSRSEARGNVILEALATRTPVAAARVGGIPELLRDTHGRLFEPNDARHVLAALLELTADPELLLQLGAAAERFARASGLTWQAHAQETLKLYQRLTGSRGKRSGLRVVRCSAD
jgi:glycosyltransferase involved in cell wall biosynthesis